MLDGETILGERENITEGLSGSFSLTLEEGEYTIRCNGGERRRRHAEGDRRARRRGSSPEARKAIAGYRKYLEENTEELTATTKPFVAAVIAGNIAKAKKLYPTPRINYERIEPVAETFGDLDPRIDARENDVPPSEFGGFHRIEKALWEEETTKGMKPVAEGLLEDVEELEEKVKGVKLQAVQIANGANELLTEVSTSKITGEEERYSHIDLVDFKANVEGSQVAFEAVAPLVPKNEPKPGQGNRSGLRSRLRGAEALRNDQVARLRPLRRTDQSRHPQTRPGDRHAGREALARSGPDRQGGSRIATTRRASRLAWTVHGSADR